LEVGLHRALTDVDAAALALNFMGILNWIPYEIHLPLENYYHSVILAVLKVFGFKVSSEESTAEGRLDLRLELTRDIIYIFEFKFEKFLPESKPGKTTASDQAAAQVQDNKAGKTGKTKTEEEIKSDLMAKAILEAKNQLVRKGYAQKYLREYKKVHQVAVGIVGRATVGAELL
jgi:hypothetical protein